MMSIRRRMALWMALGVFGVTATFCGLTYLLVRQMLIADFDRAALEQLQSVANTVKVWTDGDIYVELNPTLMTGFAADGDRAFVVRDVEDGTLIAQSISLDAANTTLSGPMGVTSDAPLFTDGQAPNGAEAVVVSQIMFAQWGWDLADTTIETAPGVRETQVALTLAIDRRPLDSRLRNLGVLTASIAIAAALAAAGAALIAVRTVLRPLNDLARRTTEIKTPTYDRPFSVDGPVELRPIAARLNDLLARLADASLVERRFTADAAHELRTPIAELRTLTDVALRFPTAPEQLENVIQSSNDLSIRLSSLVDALLGIARKDAMAASLQRVPVDPPELLRAAIAQRRAQADDRDLQIDLQGPETHRIMSDATLLESIFHNLIGNAVAHAPANATIKVVYAIAQEGFDLTISNPAPSLDAGDLDRIFEPFWRKDGHTSDDSHAGLGLALCKGFAEILGLDLTGDLTPQGQFVVRLRQKAKAAPPS